MVLASRVSVPASVDSRLSGPFDTLRRRITGNIFTSDTPGYDEARSTLYNTIDRRPLAVVKAANVRDVAAAVSFAASRDFPLSVRSGGHSLAHLSVVDGAVVVDLSQMKSVSIDPVQQIAHVQAGATSGDLAGPAAAHGLALSTGDTHSVGMGGLTTGGGIGFMARKYGLAIDNLISAEVVLANGEIVNASEKENSDLFWAIRGGGGNFGIVTEFTYRLAKVPQILGGIIAIPATPETVRAYLDYSISAPDDLTTIANVIYAPPLPFVPAEHVGKLVIAILVTWTGSIEDGEKALAPLRELAKPIVDLVSPMPYPAMYQMTAHQAEPHSASIRSMFANDLSEASIDAIFDAMAKPSSPMAIVQLRGMGGAVGHVAPEATAFAHRTQPYFVAIINLWLDPNEDETAHKTWTEALWNAIRPDADGVYVNFLEDEGKDRVREAYPAATYDRLAEIKRQYDPTNLFRFNQNIAPKR